MNSITGVVETITSKPVHTILVGSTVLGAAVALSRLVDVPGLDSKLGNAELATRGAMLGAVLGAPFAYLANAGVVFANTDGLGIAQSGKFRVLNNSNRLADYSQRPDLSREPTAPADYTWAENSRGDSYLIVDPKYKL